MRIPDYNPAKIGLRSLNTHIQYLCTLIARSQVMVEDSRLGAKDYFILQKLKAFPVQKFQPPPKTCLFFNDYSIEIAEDHPFKEYIESYDQPEMELLLSPIAGWLKAQDRGS